MLAAGVSTSTTAGASSTPDAADRFAPDPLDEPASITVAVGGRVAAYLPLLVADAKDEFAKENLSVDVRVVPVSDAILLLTQGQLDATAFVISAGPLNLIAGGDPFRFVFPFEPEYPEGSQASGFWVHRDRIGADGFQPADLAGGRLGSSVGIASPSVGYFWSSVLNIDGDFAVDDIRIEQIADSDVATALANGALDAGLVFSPYDRIVRESECCEYVGGDAPFPFGYWAFGPGLLGPDREVGAAYLRAVARTTVTYLQPGYMQDPDIGPLIADLLGQPYEVLREQPESQWDPSFPIDPAATLRSQEFFSQLPDVLSYDTMLTVDDVFDLSFHRELIGDPDVP